MITLASLKEDGFKHSGMTAWLLLRPTKLYKILVHGKFLNLNLPSMNVMFLKQCNIAARRSNWTGIYPWIIFPAGKHKTSLISLLFEWESYYRCLTEITNSWAIGGGERHFTKLQNIMYLNRVNTNIYNTYFKIATVLSSHCSFVNKLIE